MSRFLHPIPSLVHEALDVEGAAWDGVAIADMAMRQVPDRLLGENEHVLRGDALLQWTSWFVDALFDPARLRATERGYAFLYAETLAAVNTIFGDLAELHRRELARSAADACAKRVARESANVTRRGLTDDERWLLLEVCGVPPRCWICGYVFHEVAVDIFRRNPAAARDDLPLPMVVDVLKPAGLLRRDLLIEVDHVIPVCVGGDGGENLRLACGWCNRWKGGARSLYDVPGRARRVRAGLRHGSQIVSKTLPHPFWVVRLIATYRGRESAPYPAQELTVAPRNPGGELNPVNLVVVPRQADRFAADRMVGRQMVAAMWGLSVD